ncbi:MAG: methylamine utilization protein [Ideonella sp.]|nr:methylamine utilization protein [Ideonella sp.]
MPFPVRFLVLTTGALATSCHVLAAGVSVNVTDAQGRPAVDAVVMLEPAAGKVPVRPMPQVDVSQARRTFTPRVTAVTVGTPVNFPNFDTVRHHVFSISPAKTFELKLYAGVPNKPIVFDKAGLVILGCNIHDTMVAWILVSDTPWYGVAGEDGKVRIADVPAGSYRLRVWHPALAANAEAPVVAVNVGSTELQLASRLAVSTTP